MTPHIKMTELVNRKHSLLRQGKIAEAVQVNEQIEQLKQETEQVPVSKMMESMTQEEKDEARRRMIRMFVFTDLLDGAVTDFESYLRRFDPSSSVIVCQQAKRARKIISDIISTVDKTEGGCYSEHHAAMCDEVGLMVQNIFYKHETKG